MRYYSANQLDTIARWVNGFLPQLRPRRIAHPVVGRCWPTVGMYWRIPGQAERFNMQDEEMAHALLTLASAEARGRVGEMLGIVGIDYDALTAAYAAQRPAELTDTERAVRWLYLNKTFWWPRFTHGRYGQQGPTDWRSLLLALERAALRLRGCLVSTLPANDFIAANDEEGVVLLSDLTGFGGRTPQAYAPARHATHVVIAPTTSAFRQPRGWTQEPIGGRESLGLGWIYSSVKLPLHRQGSLMDLMAEANEREAEARGEVLV